MIVFFLLFLPLVGGDERGPPIVVEGQNEVADLDIFFVKLLLRWWWIHFFIKVT